MLKKKNKLVALLTIVLLSTLCIVYFGSKGSIQHTVPAEIISYTIDPKQHEIKLYWKGDSGQILKTIGRLKAHIEKQNETLIFAMNAGMFKRDNTPQGLFIDNHTVITKVDTVRSGYGNFYLQPNGIFYITDTNEAVVCTTTDFNINKNVKYATQSGPMLVIDGKIHSAFKKGSTNLNIRNGVGILPDGRVVFAISKGEINFYDFATFFKDLGCKNTLYLDGFVSRMYLPEKNWQQTNGNFGVMVGVTKTLNRGFK